MELLPPIKERYSGRAFSTQPVEQEKLALCFEAARLAPSSYNEQPWRFVYAHRKDEVAYTRLYSVIGEFNHFWVSNAPLLIACFTKTNLTLNGNFNRHSYYDLGQAVANFVTQATALGLNVRQMGGFDAKKAEELIGVPEGYEAVCILAVGYSAPLETMSEKIQEAEKRPRTRKSMNEIVFNGTWGEVKS
jgi:nitroreductase